MSHLVVVGAKVRPDIRVELEQLAQRNDRTLSGEVRLALRRHLALEGSASGTTDPATVAAAAATI